MKRKIIFIIVGALLILALVFVLWFWFFGRHNKTDILPNNGSFGTASTSDNGSANGGDNGNGQAPFGSNTGVGGTAGGNGGTQGGSGSNSGSGTTGGDTTNIDSNGGSISGGTINGGVISTTSTGSIQGSGNIGTISQGSGSIGTIGSTSIGYVSMPPGVIWLGGNTGGYTGGVITGSTGSTTGGGSGVNGGGYSFDTTPINDVNGSRVNGTPNIATVKSADGSTDLSILSSIGAVVGGCIVQYGVSQAAGRLTTVTDLVNNLFAVNVSDNPTHTNTAADTISQCLIRSLGRIAVQQITQSTVNWINSGFNGQPAYVQDFGKFFSDVADKSAGEFIQGSGLAFLCSPFQLKVKIAIAQAYANRKSGSASSSSCTLSGVTGNIQNFLKGNFSDGGWPAFLQFTTVPANNPYAGYIQGQIALNNKVIYDTNNAKDSISPGGFLSQKQCAKDPVTGKDTTNCKIVTPGSAIESSLSATFQGQLDSLQLGDSIDQIIGALTNQLITKMLYNGLANVNQSGTTSNDPNSPTNKAGTLMTTLQASVTAAQQYASVEQGIISDIQSAQKNLSNLANCWSLVASSSASTPGETAQGNDGFAASTASIAQLEAQVALYNAKITAANDSIASLQNLQTGLLLATTPDDVTKVQAQYQALQAAGQPHLYAATDVTSAQQDRATVQSTLATTNQTTSAQLTQCYATGQ